MDGCGEYPTVGRLRRSSSSRVRRRGRGGYLTTGILYYAPSFAALTFIIISPPKNISHPPPSNATSSPDDAISRRCHLPTTPSPECSRDDRSVVRAKKNKKTRNEKKQKRRRRRPTGEKGIAAFGDAPSAAAPAVLIIAIIGAFSAYGFSLIGRVCAYTGARTYRDAWSSSVGDSSSWMPAATVTLKTCFAVLSYSMILAETVRSLAGSAGFAVGRTQALLGITCTTLLPLCLVKNLSGLAPFSLVGVAGMFYTALAMGARYLGGSYAVAAPAAAATAAAVAKKGAKVAAIAGGRYVADVAADLRPQFGTVGASGALSPNVFILVCLLSTAYMAHFNAPKFYVELKDNTLRRYNAVVASSFGISIFLFASIGSLGFLTFGKASSGLILNNYSGKDALMGLSRIAVLVSIVFSFPLAFAGARDGWLDLLRVPVEDRTDAVLTKTTFAILSGITLAASRLKELAFIMSFAGATMGNALIYVYPALMFRGAVRGMGDKASRGLKREVPFAMFTALLGVAMGGMGAKMALGLL